MKYIVKYLNNTKQCETNFDEEYHKKYIGKAGEYIQHWHTTGTFLHFACLKFSNDDADWFHLCDLEKYKGR